MCRIAGLLNKKIPAATLTAYVSSMCSTLKHGGPDDEGMYTNAAHNFVFGHRRLSIIDLSANGHQPMFYKDGRYVITYNGELYNYPQLKEALKKEGFHFTTACDTEVILAAYAAWGTNAFEKFSGMFAFALADNLLNEIILVRDSAGIKPLYYSLHQQALAFASEVRAFNCIPGLQQKNDKWPVYLLAYGHLPEPVTTHKNILPLQKGTYLVYKINDGTVKMKAFKKYTFLEKIDDRNEAISLIRQTLEQSVQRHLVANSPIGVFLSGGLDSSVIAMLAGKHVSMLNTVSLYFDDSRYSEKKYQDLVKQNLSCSHHQHLLTEQDFHNYLPEIISAMDLPGCDGINTWVISKYAKEAGLKAVLSGVGGDELYGGYPSFERIKTAALLQMLPDQLLKSIGALSRRQRRRIVYLTKKNTAGRYLFLRGQFIPADIAKNLDTTEASVWKILDEEPCLPDISHLSLKNQASWMETNMYMQNQLLRDADVMSMAHGVEIRVPFLDTAFLDLSFKIQSNIKYAGLQGKQLLIDTFKDILPEQIWNRPKMGFAFPFKAWLSSDRYKVSLNKHNVSDIHSDLVTGKIHWSQFFTVFLIKSQAAA